MSREGDAVAAAAKALIGAPFRLQGRDPELGLDCIGLVACALKSAGFSPVVPAGYALRNASISGHLRCAWASGLIAARAPFEPGDIVLVKPGPGQHHLLIANASGGFIHAHAGQRKVMEMPGPLSWPVIALWRVKAED